MFYQIIILRQQYPVFQKEYNYLNKTKIIEKPAKGSDTETDTRNHNSLESLCQGKKFFE